MTKGNAICTNYPSKIRWRMLKFEFGWWQLSNCSKTLSALSRNWHMCNTYTLKWIQCILSYNIEWKVETCIRKFSEYGSLDYPYQFNAGNIYSNLATPPPFPNHASNLSMLIKQVLFSILSNIPPPLNFLWYHRNYPIFTQYRWDTLRCSSTLINIYFQKCV